MDEKVRKQNAVAGVYLVTRFGFFVGVTRFQRFGVLQPVGRCDRSRMGLIRFLQNRAYARTFLVPGRWRNRDRVAFAYPRYAGLVGLCGSDSLACRFVYECRGFGHPLEK